MYPLLKICQSINNICFKHHIFFLLLHSSSRYPEEYWSKAPYEDYVEEMVGQREILHHFANISRDSLLGMRVPFLHPGGNDMMSALYDYDFVYDSSVSVPMTQVRLHLLLHI